MDAVTNVKKQQNVVSVFKVANIFSLALDESVDTNNNPRSAIVVRHCCNHKVHEEPCWLKATVCIVLLKKVICLVPFQIILRNEESIHRRYLQLQQTAHLL